MKIRMTRRRCGLACGLLLTSWGATPVVGANEAGDSAVAPPPGLIQLDASTDLAAGLGAPATERVEERHPNRMLKVERHVAQDELGNYYNHGAYTEWDDQGRMAGRGNYAYGERDGKWTRWFTTAETEEKFAPQLELGFAAPFTSQADFREGKLNGAWTIVDAKQRPVAAWEFADGVRHGISLWWFADGKKYREAEYCGGDLDGFVREFSGDQQIVKQIEYVAGRRRGTHVEYYETGELKSECETTFAKNIVISHDDWWNGTNEVTAGGRVGEDVRHGKYQAWDRAGNLILTGTYVENLPESKFTWYFANGNKAIEGSYAGGKQHGEWTWWYANGQKEITGEYLFGNETGHWKQWGSDGKLAETLDIRRGDAFEPMHFPSLEPSQQPPVPHVEPASAHEPVGGKPAVKRVSFDEPTADAAGFDQPVAPEPVETTAPAVKPVIKLVPQRRAE